MPGKGFLIKLVKKTDEIEGMIKIEVGMKQKEFGEVSSLSTFEWELKTSYLVDEIYKAIAEIVKDEATIVVQELQDQRSSAELIIEKNNKEDKKIYFCHFVISFSLFFFKCFFRRYKKSLGRVSYDIGDKIIELAVAYFV